GRLLTDNLDKKLQSLLKRAGLASQAPWLRPLSPSLILPGGPLSFILKGDGPALTAMAICADGQRTVFSSGASEIHVRDLRSGHLMRSLTGYNGDILSLALSEDGRIAV